MLFGAVCEVVVWMWLLSIVLQYPGIKRHRWAWIKHYFCANATNLTNNTSCVWLNSSYVQYCYWRSLIQGIPVASGRHPLVVSLPTSFRIVAWLITDIAPLAGILRMTATLSIPQLVTVKQCLGLSLFCLVISAATYLLYQLCDLSFQLINFTRCYRCACQGCSLLMFHDCR